MVTRTRRLIGLPLIAALLVTVLVAPQAHAATVTTWAQLRDAFAAGGSITVGADISGGGITASQSTPVTLDLNGYDVTLTGGPAVRIEGNAKVTLQDSDGTGSLNAVGTSRTAAAIGTVDGRVTAGELTIDGADVTAQLGYWTDLFTFQDGATVGGGKGVDGLTLTVEAGSLTAITSAWTRGAAIGGGNQANSGAITINGGTVTATHNDDDDSFTRRDGAAIGGGREGTANITVNNGVITATSNGGGAAIGAGNSAHGGTIRINGGQVTATSNGNGAAIGGGQNGDGGTIRLEGRLVTATGNGNGAAIGGGYDGDGGTITFGFGYVTATGNGLGAAIGGGSKGDGGTITFEDGSIDATSNGDGAAIGGGSRGVGGTITFEGGTITATSNGDGSGVGGGYNGHGGAVTISGGILDVSAPDSASTFGAGEFGYGAPTPADFGTLRILGTALAGNPNAVGGMQASPVEALRPASPIRFSLENGPGRGADHVRTKIVLGHNVNYDAKGGTAVEPEFVAHGEMHITKPKDPTREGYDFVGWTYQGKSYIPMSIDITEDITIVAEWKSRTASVPSNPDGGSAVSPVNLVDVSSSSSSKHYTQFHREVSWLASTGITKGWNVGGGKYEFRAKEPITREAMAAFMYRYAGSPKIVLPAKSPFKDVTPSNTNFYKEIIWMNQQGISTGWNASGGKEFRPKDNITRDAMAAFMYRFAGKPATTPPTVSPFRDVAKSSQFYREVTWLADTGISKGWSVGGGKYEYRPYDQISREAMAAFLYRFNQL